MQTVCTTGSGENGTVSGRGVDPSYLHTPSGEAHLKGAIQSCGIEANSIKQLLNEFKGLYEQRLRCLELDTTIKREELQQKKVDFLQSYVNDLTDQNQVLVQTIEDLQNEDGCKVSSLGMKPHTSDRVLDVDLRTFLLDELIGPTADTPRSTDSLVQNPSESHDLKIQLQAKDVLVSELKREVRENSQPNQETATQMLESSERLVHLQSELSCLQRIHKDNMKEIAEKDICITKLQANIQLLQQEAAHTHAQLEVSREQVGRQSRELSGFYQKEETLVCEAEAKMARLKDELSAFFEKRVEEKEALIHQLTEELNGAREKMKEREDHVKHLHQDVVGLRATQDSLKRTLAMKERHTLQLDRHNTQLKESLATLHSRLQTSECMLNDMNETLDRTRNSLNADRQQRQKIQDQLHHARKEAERLELELTHARRTSEKKIQKREIKMCALVKELTDSKRQHSDCEKELLRRDTALEKLREERDELRAKMEDRSKECVHLSQTQERLEADLALSHEKLHTSHLEIRSRDELILQLRAEMKTAEQKHQETRKQVTALEGEVRDLNHEVRGRREEACQLSKKVGDVERLKDQKEKEQQQLHNQLYISEQQVRTFEAKLKKQEMEMQLLHQQLKGAKDELKAAGFQTQEQKETGDIFKQKYTAAMEKVHRVQGQVELLEEELQYSQQQLRESQLATHSMKEELAELEQRYKEKVNQWESSQEALDQLTDELQANQNLLKESQRKVEHFKSVMGSLQGQMETLKQQKLMVESDLRLHQHSHSHSDEEYLGLLRLRQQLQKCCTEQVERLAECEKAILQMKSELERQTQEKMSLKKSLAASHRMQLSNRSQLEQEVTRLKKEVTCLEIQLSDTQKEQGTLLRQSEEELKEARRESTRRSREAEVQRAEVQRLQEELLKEEEKVTSIVRENQSLSAYMRQLSQELVELRSVHQVTVEELAARAEEVRRIEGCLNEGKLAEEKIRSMAVKREKEVAELRENLQQAVRHTLSTEREKQEAQNQVNALRSELEGIWSDNAELRHESQLLMTNVNVWITEQKASNESLTAQLKALNKVLLIVTEEKQHLQEANDTLKAEVKRLKEVVDEKERDMEHFKAHIRDRGIRQDGKTVEKKGRVALNLSKIEDMQTKLQSNLEAIGMLNQQLNVLSGENKQLRRQLEEERSMHRQVEQLLPPPPTSQRRSSVHLPLSLSALPSPISGSLPSSLGLPRPLSLDPVTGHTGGTPARTKPRGARSERPGESRALGEELRMRPTAERSVSASLEDAWSGRTSRHLAK